MFLKQIDILSPEITLFYKGSLSHSSIISGILTIIAFVIIALCSIIYIKDILFRNAEEPKVSTYTRFLEDAGEFPINSSALFHFISIVKDSHNPEDEEFDFTSFNLIGLDTYIQDYITDNNLTKYNHWIYGFCNNESDTIGISHLIIKDFLMKSACIKKYYDISTKQYYSTEHPKFRWPKMSHGTFNPKKEFYTIILKKCDQKYLNEIFGNKYICKNEDEINEFFKFGVIHFNYIDQYVNILKHDEPNQKYFYRIENTLDKNNYSINHLNFNPIIIKTNCGLIYNHINEQLEYSYDRTDVFTHKVEGDIYMGYSLWLNNRVSYNERSYKTIQDALSEVGGVAQSIMFVAVLINNFFNKYIILSDTQKLLSSSNISINDIVNKPNKLKFKKTNLNLTSQNVELTSIKKMPDKIKYTINPHSKDEIEDKTKALTNKEILENPIYNDDNNYKFEDTNIVTNKDNEIDINNQINNNIEKISFKKFFFYKISLGKKYNNLKLYEEFRENIISVENLIKNHLDVNSLIKCRNNKNS